MTDPIDIQYLKGIGPKRAAVLNKAGIKSTEDLLEFFPRKYIDRSHVVPIAELKSNEEVTVYGKIQASGIRHTRKRIFYLVIFDGKDFLEAVWFNSIEHFRKIFKIGDWVALSGKVAYYRGYQMVHPSFDIFAEEEFDESAKTGRIFPLYRGSELFNKMGLTSRSFSRIFQNLFERDDLQIDENFSEEIRKRFHFPERYTAFRKAHLPTSSDELDSAIKRLKFEEFFYQQLLFALQHGFESLEEPGIAFDKSSSRLNKLFKNLPFTMTAAQQRTVKEIRSDMKRPHPMNRLLQGDVGAGKTLVALMAMLIAVDNGYKAALMAPTEILAEQHFLNLNKSLADLDVDVLLLTGSTKKQARLEIGELLASEKPLIILGTHALIQDAVNIHQLGLVVIDEQHRFGVMQRAAFAEKGYNPDVLVMTATPIPRTLALTVYGNLDVSVLDEMPPGRKAIQTHWRYDDKARQVYDFVLQRIEKGDQAYIVFPLVEESEKMDLKAATESYEALKAGIFKNTGIAVLHGRMKANEKEDIMRRFSLGEIQVLVSTTVIEVGIDVANATIMLIEHAERFGLSQLHQLRGRVGRGDKQSYCILKTPYNIGEVARQRMKIMTESNDGFYIAEADLKLRGWGEFFGTRQSGMPEFKLANPVVDYDLLQQARNEAFVLVEKDPHLRAAQNKPMRDFFSAKYKDKLSLITVS